MRMDIAMDDAVKEKLPEDKIYTLDDIYNLPEGVRAELLNGEIYYMAPPGWTHQRISMALSSEIAAYIKKQNGDCQVLAAPFAVFLNEGSEKNYLEPDISVICDISRLDEKGCHGAPDWVIEIVSPSSRPRDYIKKMIQYCTAGVREYWIVDPDKKSVFVYGFEADRAEQYDFGKDVPAGIFEGFSIRVE